MVSVIVPSYNHAAFLKERIDSILNQTFHDFELIILDDCSPDNSRQIIEQYRNNPHVSHIVINEQNSGSTIKQWTKGINLAKGEYIWIAESDDVAEPTLLQTLYNNMTRNQGVVLSYCQSYNIDAQGDVVGDWEEYTRRYEPELFSRDFVMEGPEFIERCFLIKNFIPNTSAVLFRKDAFIEAGCMDGNVGYITDWLCWLKILTRGKVAFTTQKLNRFRRHLKPNVLTKKEQGHTVYKEPHIEMRKAFARYIKKSQLPLSKKIYSRNKRFLIRNHLEQTHFLFQHKRFLKGIEYCVRCLKYIF